MLDRYDQGDKCLTNLTPELIFSESCATENILRVVERMEGGWFGGCELDIDKERARGRSRGHRLWSRQSPTIQGECAIRGALLS